MSLLQIILTCIVAIGAIALEKKWGRLTFWGKVLFVAGIALAIIVLINDLRKNNKEALVEKINAKYGDLLDKSKVTIPTLEIGNSGLKISLPNSGTFIKSGNGNPIIKLYVKDKKLNVYTIIRDSTGNPVAVIDDNTWKVFDDNYEYNNDDTAFELVTKGERNVYFHVYLSADIAHLEGIFFTEDKHGFCFSSRGASQGVDFLLFGTRLPFNIHNRYIKDRIFKYPREKYLGVRAE